MNRLKLNTLRSLKAHGGVDRALLSFDLDVDFKPAFHWNIKQLFVYVVASYESNKNPVNNVVLWDKIIEAVDGPESMVIKENEIFCKYALVATGARASCTTTSSWHHTNGANEIRASPSPRYASVLLE